MRLSILLPLLACLLAGCATPTQVPRAEGYAFWPPLPDEPRVQFLTSFRFSSDVEPEQSALDELVFGSERMVLPIGKPYGIAMWKGRIYVCDITNPGVVILDLRKRQTRLMGTRSADPMAQPVDIAIASDGMKYVVDRRLGRIFVFNAEDRHVMSLGQKGWTPVGVAVAGDELYVPDFQTQSVVVMDRFSGEVRRSIGEAGGEAGQFVRPLGVAVDDAGEVYVTDAINARLQKFSPEGEVRFVQGQIADSAGNFTRPKHVAVDPDGIIYVVDAAFQNVQMFNDDSELLMFFGNPGEHPGSMSLPAGIEIHEGDLDLFEPYVHPAFEARRLVLVSNQFGLNKVAVYALGGLKPGRTIQDIAPQAAEIGRGLVDEPELEAVPGSEAEPGAETGSRVNPEG